jgi:tripartite-type tricarboxylate transporter receptor subunit TctC
MSIVSTISRRDALRLSIGATASTLFPVYAARASTADRWPTRSITVVIPFPPGGQAELAAVPIAAELGRLLGVDVELDYRPGGSGAIGNANVAHAAPDGSRILVGLTSVVSMPDAFRLQSQTVPYEIADLRPVARILSDPLVLAVSSKAPWTTLEAFIADARSRPGAIKYGTSGAFGAQHVAMTMLTDAEQLKLQHKPYQGAGPALKALLAGELDCTPSAAGLLYNKVKEGKLKVLASWGAQRIEAFQSVPTFEELGYRGMVYMLWAGVLVPAAMPEPLVLRLRAAVQMATESPAIKALFQRAGSHVAYLGGNEFQSFATAERQRLLPFLEKIQAGASALSANDVVHLKP